MALAAGVGSKGATGSGTSQATTGVTTQASGSLIVAAEIFFTSQTFSSIADSKSNSYTILGAEQSMAAGSGLARFYYKENAVGGASHTVTFTNSGGAFAITDFMFEITGALTSGALDGAVQQVNDAASPFTLAITPSAGNRILVAFFAGDSGSNPATNAESSGFTIIAAANETNGTTFWTGCLAYKIVVGDGSTAFTASFTETGGASCGIFLASFKEAPTSSIGARKGLGPSGGPRKNRLRSTRSFETSGSVGVLTGTASIVFAPTGTLTGAGALTGSATLTFSPTSTLTGSAPVTGSTSLTFSPTGTLIGIGALTGSTSLTFSPTSTLTGSGALTGATTLTFAPTSTLTGTGALTGTASITFSPTGTLADATSGLTGASSITFTVTGTLTGSGALAGVTSLTFTPTGILTDASAVVIPEQNSGGFYFDFEYHREQRKRRKKREEELQREVDEIQANLDREIAKLLRAQEAKDAERADLERIQAMADKFAGTRQQVPRNIAASLLKAQEERSRNALEQLYREMDREMEAEEVFALLLILNQ